MDGTFELNKPGWYTPKLVTENEFLNSKLESDMYGIYYSVLFEGDAETYLLQAKKAPVEGVKEWGHIAESKSGKSMRFKRDKQDEAPQHSSSASRTSSGNEQYLKDTSDLPRSLIIELLKYYDVQSLYNSPQYTKMIALAQSLNDDIMLMIKANRSGSQETVVPTTHAEPIKAGIVTPATRTSPGDEFRGRNEPEYSDADIPEDMR